jgi:hypothetical protein
MLDRGNAWLISDYFEESINLSNVIKLKVNKIFLGNNQIILDTKKGHISVSWGVKI